MILSTLCNTCLQPYSLTITAEERSLVDTLADKDGLIACPRLCGGKITLDGSVVKLAEGVQLRDPLHISGKELYQAVNGMGLPDEVTDDPDLIEALLKTNRIASVQLEQAMGRLFLHELRLVNGMTVHLAAGAKGAQLLKVTRRVG